MVEIVVLSLAHGEHDGETRNCVVLIRMSRLQDTNSRNEGNYSFSFVLLTAWVVLTSDMYLRFDSKYKCVVDFSKYISMSIDSAFHAFTQSDQIHSERLFTFLLYWWRMNKIWIRKR